MGMITSTRVRWAALLIIASFGTHASVNSAAGVHLYAHANEESQRTATPIAISELNIVSLGDSWIKTKLKSGISVWVAADSVRKLTVNQIFTRYDDIAAYLEIPSDTSNDAAAKLAAKLPHDTLFTIVAEKAGWLQLSPSSDIELWVNAQEYLHVTRASLASAEFAEQSGDEEPSASESDDFTNWLCAQPPKEKTLQLASFKEPDAVNKFLDQYPQINDEHLVKATSLDQNWHYLLYGHFADDREARQRLAELALNRQSVSIRSFNYLQAMRCNLNSLADS